MPKFILAFLFSFFIFSLTSCSDEEPISITILDNEAHSISQECVGDNIIFTINSKLDSTDNTNGTWPVLDLVSIYVDFNNNALVDNNLDLLIARSNDQLCVARLLSQTSTTGCSFPDNAEYIPSFNITVSHMISVPKDLISDENRSNVVFVIYDGEGDETRYPSDLALFDDTIEITW